MATSRFAFDRDLAMQVSHEVAVKHAAQPGNIGYANARRIAEKAISIHYELIRRRNERVLNWLRSEHGIRDAALE